VLEEWGGGKDGDIACGRARAKHTELGRKKTHLLEPHTKNHEPLVVVVVCIADFPIHRGRRGRRAGGCRGGVCQDLVTVRRWKDH